MSQQNESSNNAVKHDVESPGLCEFDKNRIYQLLTNVTYAGKLTYKDEIHEGQHQAIVDAAAFDRVSRSLRRNGRTGGLKASTKFDGLLRGILRCARCDRPMLHTSTGSGPRRYRYYICGKADKHGYDTCDTPSIPAGQIEEFVVNELRTIAGDDHLVREIYDRTHEHSRETVAMQKNEIDSLREFLRTDYHELNHLITSQASVDLIEAAQTRISENERRLAELKKSIDQHSVETVSHQNIRETLQQFDHMWETMPSKDRCRLIELLIRTVNFDGLVGTIDITFHTNGITTLGNDQSAFSKQALQETTP